MDNTEHLVGTHETDQIMSDLESFRMYQESLKDIREGRVHDHDDVKRELGIALQESFPIEPDGKPPESYGVESRFKVDGMTSSGDRA